MNKLQLLVCKIFKMKGMVKYVHHNKVDLCEPLLSIDMQHKMSKVAIDSFLSGQFDESSLRTSQEAIEVRFTPLGSDGGTTRYKRRLVIEIVDKDFS